jgi:hypothetical protein
LKPRPAGLLAASVLALACNLLERDAPLSLDGNELPPEAPVTVERIGVSAVHAEAYDLRRTGASWYLNWTAVPAPATPLEFVPMVCAYTDREPVTASYLEGLRRQIETHREWYPDRTLFVLGNEIGYRPQQDSRTPEQYARDFQACAAMLRGLDRSYRVAAGPVILAEGGLATRGYVGGGDGLAYLDAVLEAYPRLHGEPLPADFLSATAHVSEGEGVDLAVFERQVVRFRRFLAERGLAERRVVITEFGAPLGSPAPRDVAAFLAGAMQFLASARDEATGCPADGHRLVQRFAWFTAHALPTVEKLRSLGAAAFLIDLSQTSLFTRDGRLNYLGKAYAAAARQITQQP